MLGLVERSQCQPERDQDELEQSPQVYRHQAVRPSQSSVHDAGLRAVQGGADDAVGPVSRDEYPTCDDSVEELVAEEQGDEIVAGGHGDVLVQVVEAGEGQGERFDRGDRSCR